MIFNNKYTFDFCISWYGFLINVKILLLEPIEKKNCTWETYSKCYKNSVSRMH